MSRVGQHREGFPDSTSIGYNDDGRYDISWPNGTHTTGTAADAETALIEAQAL